MTKTLYLSDTYLFESEAQIINYGEDAKGSFIILDRPNSGFQHFTIG